MKRRVGAILVRTNRVLATGCVLLIIKMNLLAHPFKLQWHTPWSNKLQRGGLFTL